MKRRDNDSFIRDRINLIRKNSGLSERTFSELIGCNPTYISSMNRKKHIPSIPVLRSICDYAGITLTDFFSAEFSHNKSVDSIGKLLSENYDEETIDLLYTFISKMNEQELKAFLKPIVKNSK